MKLWRINLFLLLLALATILCNYGSQAKGGGGGGGGGRGGGGGGGRGGVGRSGSGAVGKTGGGGKFSAGKKVGLITAGGVATYAAYKGYKSAHRNKDYDRDRDRDSPDFDADGWDSEYRVQERTAYSRGEGGMSAVAIIFLVLAIIGAGSAIWCFYNIGLPCWRDRQSKRNRTMTFPHVITMKGDDIPLRETPSTASPSPK